MRLESCTPSQLKALGQNSKAVHRAYAKRAKVKIPALRDYEKKHSEKSIHELKDRVGGIELQRFRKPAKRHYALRV
jgi:hypothetical protein